MILTSLTLHGFRRFKDPSTLRISSRVMALLGPNEVGKSSVLVAISRMGDDQPIPPHDLSTGVDVPQDQAVIKVQYTLSPADVYAVREIAGASGIRLLTIAKLRGGQRIFSYSPVGEVDESTAAADVLAAFAAHPTAAKGKSVRMPLEALKASRPITPDLVRRLREAIAAPQMPETAHRDLTHAVERLAWHVGESAEGEQVRAHLATRVPTAVNFAHDDRNLEAAYNIASIAEKTPVSLGRVLHAAGLDVRRLAACLGRSTDILRMERRANSALANAFRGKWRQSTASISLHVNGPLLELHVENHPASDVITTYGERSDGFRMFVALFAMLGRADSESPILLLDEAEQHLHYDAQADLVRMLQTQGAAQQVIYTTHSAGCLPDDLGRGVAAIVECDGPWSRFCNNFWQSEEERSEPGVRPMLVAMGASATAFLPLRPALFVEGFSDTLLLPQLFREATKSDDVGFQVVPSLATASPHQIGGLRTQASAIACLVDGDEGGADLKAKLIAEGVPETDIFSLPVKAVEQCIEKLTYVGAVNECLAGHGTISETDLGPENWPKDVERWCRSRALRTPSKITVAYALLRQAEVGRAICAENMLQQLALIVSGVDRVLGIERSIHVGGDGPPTEQTARPPRTSV